MELRAITYMFRFEDCAGTDPRTMLRACIFGQQKRLSRNYVAENLSFSSFFGALMVESRACRQWNLQVSSCYSPLISLFEHYEPCDITWPHAVEISRILNYR